jgi:transposase
MIMAYVQGEDRYQISFFPECIDDYIAPDNPVRVIEVFVERMIDTKKSGFTYAITAPTGRPPYDPKDMLKLYIYGYLNRVRSSRALEAEAGRNLEVMWLMKKIKPDHKTISVFRKDNEKAIKGVFKSFVGLCRSWDLLGRELVGVDGTKVRANNSKKNNFNEKKINKHLKQIDEKIEAYFKMLEQNDAKEANIPEITEEEIRARIEELMKRKETYEEYREEIKVKGEISTTDPDARLMATNNNGVDVCYNVQAAVDSKHSLVVNVDVINDPADQGHLSDMAKEAKEVLDVETLKVVADKGYHVPEDLKECESQGIVTYVAKPVRSNSTGDKDFYPHKFIYDKEKNVYLCPMGKALKFFRTRKQDGVVKYLDYRDFKVCAGCENLERCTKSKKGRTITRHVDQEFIEKVEARTKANKELYRQRQMVVEHPFGTVKRVWGYSYFLTRGLVSVKTEASLSFLAYNLRRVMNIIGVEEMIKKMAVA